MQEKTYTPNLELHLNTYLEAQFNEVSDKQYAQVQEHANTAFQEITPETVGMMPIAVAQEPPKHIKKLPAATCTATR